MAAYAERDRAGGMIARTEMQRQFQHHTDAAARIADDMYQLDQMLPPEVRATHDPTAAARSQAAANLAFETAAIAEAPPRPMTLDRPMQATAGGPNPDYRGGDASVPEPTWRHEGRTQPLGIGPIGSRGDTLTVYFRAPQIGAPLQDGPWVRTGCFSGPLSRFEQAVKERHADSAWGREYAAVIALIRALALVYEASA